MFAHREFIRCLGWLGAAQYMIQQLRVRFFKPHREFSLRSRYSRFRLFCRPNTSDFNVFRQIFVEREYSCLDSIGEAELILDCGANAGYSSAYFLTRFPGAKLIAIEPDAGNCSVLETNLAPFGQRYRVVRSAIWSEEVGLVWEEQTFRDGREWARVVRPAKPGELPIVSAVTIGSLLRQSGADRISILKIDIEKSELALFSSGERDWLDRVDNLVIELHDDDCSKVFCDAIFDRGFEVYKFNELTVCQRSIAGKGNMASASKSER